MLAQIYWFWQTMHQNRQLHCWLFLVDLLQLNKLFFFPCKRILTSIAPYGIIWSAHKLGPFCNISYYDQARFPKLLRCMCIKEHWGNWNKVLIYYQRLWRIFNGSWKSYVICCLRNNHHSQTPCWYSMEHRNCFLGREGECHSQH